MNEQAEFERFVADQLGSAAVGMPPQSAIEDTIARAGGSRRLPEWLALIKESPMRTNSHLAVGSPTFRVAAIVAATLLLALALAAAGAGVQRLFAADGPIIVAQDGSGDFATISEAVDAAGDGAHILIREGTYAERVSVVGKDLTISGDGDREDVVIDAVETTEEQSASILLLDTVSRLANLTVTGPYDGEAVGVAGIGSSADIEGVVIVVPEPIEAEDYRGVAVYWAPGSSGMLQDSLVRGTVDVDEQASVTIERNVMPASCIFAGSEGTNVVVRDNQIHGCPYELAIRVGAASTAIIEGNDIMAEDVEMPPEYWFSLGRVGIEVFGPGSGDITIRDNDIHDSRYGVQHLEGDPTESPSLTIANNRLRDNDVGLARIVGSPILSGNTISGSGQIAIELRAGTPTLEGNTLTDNFVGLALAEGSEPTLVGNTICENGTNVRLPDGATPPDTTGNEICADDVTT